MGNTTNSSSSDYFNECSNDWFVDVPKNFFGYQYARTGLGYSGICIFDRNNPYHSTAREYIEIGLISPLQMGVNYFVSFYVSRANRMNYAVDAIGLYFSKDSVLYNDNWAYPLPYIPQIQNPLGNVLKDTLNWVEISGEYTAQGGERFITIGNFLYDSLLTIETFGTSPSSNWGYYYIDDVSVIEDTGVGYKDVSGSNSKVSVYPNPSSGSVHVEVNIKAEDEGVLEITDVLGRKNENYKLNTGYNYINVPTETFSEGVYTFTIRSGKNAVIREKVIIIR